MLEAQLIGIVIVFLISVVLIFIVGGLAIALIVKGIDSLLR